MMTAQKGGQRDVCRQIAFQSSKELVQCAVQSLRLGSAQGASTVTVAATFCFAVIKKTILHSVPPSSLVFYGTSKAMDIFLKPLMINRSRTELALPRKHPEMQRPSMRRRSQLFDPRIRRRLNKSYIYACSRLGRQSGPAEPQRRPPPQPAKPVGSGKSIPRTPLAVTMAKHQQAEAEFLKERVQLKREVDQQRKRASGLEHRYSQLQVPGNHDAVPWCQSATCAR